MWLGGDKLLCACPVCQFSSSHTHTHTLIAHPVPLPLPRCTRSSQYILTPNTHIHTQPSPDLPLTTKQQSQGCTEPGRQYFREYPSQLCQLWQQLKEYACCPLGALCVSVSVCGVVSVGDVCVLRLFISHLALFQPSSSPPHFSPVSPHTGTLYSPRVS